MMYKWTSEDIEHILLQLNNQALPFKKYMFTDLGKSLRLLGKGGYANVYEAETRDKHKDLYAIKVIGFGDKNEDSDSFRKSVEAQKDLGQFQNNVVKIFDSVELRVWIEGESTVVRAEVVKADEEFKPEGDYLNLQFIVMEKVAAVLRDDKPGRPALVPSALAKFDEKEILKLAYDIGTALSQAHAKNILHRDIKLENIFYTPKGEHYKLGDFGIAKTTDDGMASTVAFTKGYGAPEVVGALEDKYDNTADIYSFGMMLFVLLNELRFPESNNYHVNLRAQYSQGYVLPWPVNGSDEFCMIVARMCSFIPDDRYQSMDEILNDFDKLMHGRGVKYRREHKDLSLVLGTVFALTGAVAWKLSFIPELHVDLSMWMYIFLALCVGKGVFKILKKDITLISVMILGVGIFLMITTGFTWWKLVLLFTLTFICDLCTGLFGGGALIANLVYLLTRSNPMILQEFQDFRWVTVLLLSLAVILLFQYSILKERDYAITRVYFKRNLFWIVISLNYLFMILTKYSLYNNTLLERWVGHDLINEIMTWKPMMIGICGLTFCIIWVGREYLLMFIESRREKKLFEQY